jgi:hypothetical protein
MTSVKKEAKQENQAIIMLKRKSFNLIRTEGSDRRLSISRLLDRELKFTIIDDVFRG